MKDSISMQNASPKPYSSALNDKKVKFQKKI